MATVGNLFVNIRGRTSGLKKDMDGAKQMVRRGHKSLGRTRLVDLQLEAARARKEYDKALESAKQAAIALEPSRRMGGAIEASGRRGRTDAMQRLSAARERMKTSGEALSRAQARASINTTLAVLGLSAGLLKGLVGQQLGQAKKGRDLVEQFKFAGPFGAQIAKIEAAKIQTQVAMAKDPKISKSFRDRAMSELELQMTQTERAGVANQVDTMINKLKTEYNLILTGDRGPGTMGLRAARNRAVITGLTGQAP